MRGFRLLLGGAILAGGFAAGPACLAAPAFVSARFTTTAGTANTVRIEFDEVLTGYTLSKIFIEGVSPSSATINGVYLDVVTSVFAGNTGATSNDLDLQAGAVTSGSGALAEILDCAVADGRPPVFVSAAFVSNTVLRVTYSEALAAADVSKFSSTALAFVATSAAVDAVTTRVNLAINDIGINNTGYATSDLDILPGAVTDPGATLSNETLVNKTASDGRSPKAEAVLKAEPGADNDTIQVTFTEGVTADAATLSGYTVESPIGTTLALTSSNVVFAWDNSLRRATITLDNHGGGNFNLNYNNTFRISFVAIKDASGNPAETVTGTVGSSATVPDFRVSAVAFSDGGDNLPDPGETLSATVTLANAGRDATVVAAALSTTDTAVTITDAASAFGTVNMDEAVAAGDPVTFTIAASVTPLRTVAFSIAITGNIEGGAPFAATVAFNIVVGQDTLLVVDDDNDTAGPAAVSTQAYITTLLEGKGFVFDTWDVAALGPPPLAELRSRQSVIWTTGEDATSGGTLTAQDQANLAAYLDGGGCLLMTSRGYLPDITGGATGTITNTLLNQYFHVQGIGPAAFAFDGMLNGMAGDRVSADLAFQLDNALGVSVTRQELIPDGNARALFRDGSGRVAAVTYFDSARFKTAFLSFPVETVPNTDPDPNNRGTLLQRVLDAFADRTFPDVNATALDALPDSSLRIILSWVNPVNPQFQAVQVVRNEVNHPTGPFDGDIAYYGNGTSFTDGPLGNDRRYYYTIFASDGAGNFSRTVASDTRASAIPGGGTSQGGAGCFLGALRRAAGAR
ncbi:MAG: hypothetical protein V1809_05185 [Planctomycetota bacterium]